MNTQCTHNEHSSVHTVNTQYNMFITFITVINITCFLFPQLNTSFAGDKQLDAKVVGEPVLITLKHFHDRYISTNIPIIVPDSDDEYVRLLYPMAVKAEGCFGIHFNVDGSIKPYEERYNSYSHRS